MVIKKESRKYEEVWINDRMKIRKNTRPIRIDADLEQILRDMQKDLEKQLGFKPSIPEVSHSLAKNLKLKKSEINF